jgi:hypothetical protein
MERQPGNLVEVRLESSEQQAVVPVNGATVAGTSWSTLDGQATGGKRWARVHVNCNVIHNVRGIGGLADFADFSVAGTGMVDELKSSKEANTAYGGQWYTFDVAGLTHFCPQVYNTTAGNATVTCRVVFFD